MKAQRARKCNGVTYAGQSDRSKGALAPWLDVIENGSCLAASPSGEMNRKDASDLCKGAACLAPTVNSGR